VCLTQGLIYFLIHIFIIYDSNNNNTILTYPSSMAIPNINQYSIDFISNRVSCGQIANFSGFSYVNAFGPTNLVYSSITIGSLTGVTFDTFLRPPTSGGPFLMGTLNSFGLVQNLAPAESVSVTLSHGYSFNCFNGAVINGYSGYAQYLSCTSPPGVGSQGNITAVLCGTAYTLISSFSYQAPIIGNVSIINSQTLSFVGSNFGPTRVFDGVFDSIIVYSTAQTLNCTLLSVSDTFMEFTVSSTLMNQISYTANLTIGGQFTQFTFVAHISSTNTQTTQVFSSQISSSQASTNTQQPSASFQSNGQQMATNLLVIFICIIGAVLVLPF